MGGLVLDEAVEVELGLVKLPEQVAVHRALAGLDFLLKLHERRLECPPWREKKNELQRQTTMPISSKSPPSTPT